MKTPTLYIFNTTIAPTPGLTYRTTAINVEEARALLRCFDYKFTSAIGHEATAQVASMILAGEVSVNRINAQMEHGDAAICIKLRGRAPEGVVLDREQMETIGYDLVLMRAVKPFVLDENEIAYAWVSAMRAMGATALRGAVDHHGRHHGIAAAPCDPLTIYALKPSGGPIGSILVETDECPLAPGNVAWSVLRDAWSAAGGSIDPIGQVQLRQVKAYGVDILEDPPAPGTYIFTLTHMGVPHVIEIELEPGEGAKVTWRRRTGSPGSGSA